MPETIPDVRVLDQSWGWVVEYKGARSHKIADHIAATQFADLLRKGHAWESAWRLLNMSQYVRTKDGGTYTG